jgi:hypothetical protein
MYLIPHQVAVITLKGSDLGLTNAEMAHEANN